MMDKSWSVPTRDPADRTDPLASRENRSAERLKTFGDRVQARAADREAAAQERERARDSRRQEEEARRAERTADRPLRPRRSGRTDVVRVHRDTIGYQTVKDVDRMRELARRGASVAGLAEAFGLSVKEVEHALAG